MVVLCWQSHPLHRFCGLLPSSHVHLHHQPDSGTQNHHRQENGEERARPCDLKGTWQWVLNSHVSVFHPLQMRDLFFFMFLLSIWVVAYGVAKQGILIHNDARLDWILRGAVYEPYRIIFGDFPTNIDCE